jgi:hypothetical protein
MLRLAIPSVVAVVSGLLVAGGERVGEARMLPEPRVWFSPAPASLDLRELFLDDRKNPAVDWQRARDRIQVFKFYTSQLLDSHESAIPNTYGALANVRAFLKLTRWHKEIALEVASIKGYSCDSADGVAALANDIINRVQADDAWVTWLALDEPLLSAVFECHITEGRAAGLVADFVRRVNARHPKAKIGLIEPYPTFSVDQIARFLRNIVERGVAMAFLHVDVDMTSVRTTPAGVVPPDVVSDLRTLDALAAARRIPFGFIVWGSAGSSDRDYFESAVTDGIDTLRQAFGEWSRMPDHLIFQSWTLDPTGRPMVPPNLPERTPYTHTFLLDFGLRCLRGEGPCRL